MKLRKIFQTGCAMTVAILTCLQFAQLAPVSASPFGKGVFGADVPFGSLTSLSINFSGSVGMILTSSGGNLSGTGSQVITITSTDVVGYSLYVHSPTTTAMTSGSNTIPASSNTTAGPLSVGTWGYNASGSTTNFIGLTTAPVLVRDRSGPFKNGDPTTVTYGTLVPTNKQSGTYLVDITYTAVGKS
jgi:hypothetical protein